jgi:Short C-terminal domain
LLLIALAPLLWWVRKHFRAWMGQTTDITGGGFTLANLRDLHRSGAMSDEEFAKAKAQLVQGLTAAAQKSAKPENTSASRPPRRSPPPRI